MDVTLHEIQQELLIIKAAINQIEIKGQENARLVIYSSDKCDKLLKQISEAREAAQPAPIEIQLVPPISEGPTGAKDESNRT